MRLRTDRLIIRSFSYDDDFELYDMAMDPMTAKEAGWAPHHDITVTRNVIMSYIYSDETYAIILRNEERLIGTISLYPNNMRPDINAREIGFCLHRDYRHKGYMQEAMKAIIEFSFEKYRVDILCVSHRVGNSASEKVIKHFPFVYEGTFRKYRRLCDGELVDVSYYSMTKEEYGRGIL